MTGSPSGEASILGIWRLGPTIHRSGHTAIAYAQPADAVGSPRWDYTIKRAVGEDREGQRQINQFVSAASTIVHPNVVPVLDASTTGSSPYLVMPLINGQTMGQSMQQHFQGASKTLPVALWLVRQLAQALDAVHSAGWVHGDVKPDNVLVGVRGHVTLIDLGFAARVHSVPNHIYRGTPDYSAPESLSGQTAIMPAMDMFSVGRLLWQWLAHIQPIHQSLLEPVAELVEQLVSEDPTDRPSAETVANRLLKLEIETLGCHIQPSQGRRAA